MYKTILYINDEYCLTLEQLKGYFAQDPKFGTQLYNELLTLQHDGLLAKWLIEKNHEEEKEIAQELEELPETLADSAMMNELKRIFTGIRNDIVKPKPSEFLELTEIRCFVKDQEFPLFTHGRHYNGNINLMKEDLLVDAIDVSFQISFKILKKANEQYTVRLADHTETHYHKERLYPYFYPTPPIGTLSPNNYQVGSTITITVPRYVRGREKTFVLTVDEKEWARIILKVNIERWPIIANGVSFDMIFVEGDKFMMGATEEQGNDAYSIEKPPHWVTIYHYFIGETPVTQELWQAVMGNNPSYFKGEERPVESVSWDDDPEQGCQTFINKLNELVANQLNGRRFHLPTEAQWEYAARGGKARRGRKYAGSDFINAVAWYSGKSDARTHDVKTMAHNELGIYDMSGNVYEWCQDWHGPYSSELQSDPVGPSLGTYRVIRGGSWKDYAGYCRVSSRNFTCLPSSKRNDLGLRLALY